MLFGALSYHPGTSSYPEQDKNYCRRNRKQLSVTVTISLHSSPQSNLFTNFPCSYSLIAWVFSPKKWRLTYPLAHHVNNPQLEQAFLSVKSTQTFKMDSSLNTKPAFSSLLLNTAIYEDYSVISLLQKGDANFSQLNFSRGKANAEEGQCANCRTALFPKRYFSILKLDWSTHLPVSQATTAWA